MAITSPTTPPTDGAALPTPPSSSSPSNFDTLADAFLSAFPGFQTSMNATKANAYENATAAYNNALQSQSDATTAQTAAATAQAYSGAIAWVSGTTYAIGDVRWSPGNGRVYRRITNGGGTTDPYNDPTNWSLVPTSVPITRITSAPITQASSGMFYEFANSTTQGAATNYCDYSNYNAGTWNNIFPATATVTYGTSDPMGGNTAVRFATNGSGQSLLRISIPAITPNGTDVYTLSFWAKLVSGSGTANADFGDDVPAGFYNSQLIANQWTRVTLTGTPSATLKTYIDIFNNATMTITIDYWGVQLEKGSSATSNITTSGAIKTRASGVVAPQRLVLPSSPVNDMIVQAMVANGIDTNIVDPNGATIMGTNGPIQLDNPYASVTFQYSSSTWRMINA